MLALEYFVNQDLTRSSPDLAKDALTTELEELRNSKAPATSIPAVATEAVTGTSGTPTLPTPTPALNSQGAQATPDEATIAREPGTDTGTSGASVPLTSASTPTLDSEHSIVNGATITEGRSVNEIVEKFNRGEDLSKAEVAHIASIRNSRLLSRNGDISPDFGSILTAVSSTPDHIWRMVAHGIPNASPTTIAKGVEWRIMHEHDANSQLGPDPFTDIRNDLTELHHITDRIVKSNGCHAFFNENEEAAGANARVPTSTEEVDFASVGTTLLGGASPSTHIPTNASKVRASAKDMSDAALEIQFLPSLKSNILSALVDPIFGIEHERTVAISASITLGASWNQNLLIKNDASDMQLQGVSLSANPNGHTLDINKPVVLFFGGSGERVESAAYGAAEAYGPENGVNFVAMNYRGYGNSDLITPSPRSIVDDGKLAYQYLRNLGFPTDKIILRGYSLGASVASRLHALSEIRGEKLGGVIYDRPLTGIQEAAEGASGHKALGLVAELLAGSLGVSANLEALDRLIGRKERLTKVLVIADDGTSPENTFLGPASKKLAVKYGLRLTESKGDHFNHAEANVASRSLPT